MKKLLFRILIVAVLTVLLLTVAVAEENTYYISELDMELTIPSGYTVLTRDLPETDSAWKVFGTSKTAWRPRAITLAAMLNSCGDGA